MSLKSICWVSGLLALLVACSPNEPSDLLGDYNWISYNGGSNSNKYVPLDQINKKNVDQLEVAWTYTMRPDENRSDIKCNLLAIDGVIYGVTGSKNLVAVDATNGEEIWYLDMHRIDSLGRQPSARGIVYWEKEDDRRLFYVYGGYLYAVNADKGTLIETFGDQGRVSYATGISDDPRRWVRLTTPGRVYKDLLITGSFVNEQLPSAPGHIRAFNTITGALEWVFHTVPLPGEYGYETWSEDSYQFIGGANNWAGMSLDEERGIVYVPTGSPTYDFWGGNRIGQNLFANSLLALNANTGERIWHYQIIHHDLWDRDLPCPPNLFTIKQNGQEIDAVAQPTKHGFVYVFNRETGEPIFEINEIPVPSSTMPGESAWPTQPIPVKPPPFTRQALTPDQITDISPEATAFVTEQLKKYKTAFFTPPDTTGVVVIPEFAGGASWGGAAVDEPTGTLFVTANEVTGLSLLINREEEMKMLAAEGQGLYQMHCSSCHATSRKGGGYIPSLLNLEEKYNRRDIRRIISRGKGKMQAMDYIPWEDQNAIAAFLLNQEYERSGTHSATTGTTFSKKRPRTFLKYSQDGYPGFEDQDDFPAIKPPWATLTSYNMNTGDMNWQIPLGENLELKEMGIPNSGVDHRGGPVVTAGGLIFIAATRDNKMRAFDKDTGAVLWEYDLDGQGGATASVYRHKGIQYLLIPVTVGDQPGVVGKYVAFTLPESLRKE